MRYLFAPLMLALGSSIFGQHPPPEALSPGVPQELARWRAAHYSDVRYKLNLTLEKMSPVLKGTLEVRVKVGTRTLLSATPATAGELPPIILDWRKIKGHEEKSTVTNVTINGKSAVVFPPQAAVADKSVRVPYENEHLIFRDGVVAGENVIKLDFTSPILTSGSAITRYVDKEDGAEYIYSLFVPSDASTAFPVFDQPDLKARFSLTIDLPYQWNVVSNGRPLSYPSEPLAPVAGQSKTVEFEETNKISSYVFAFAAGDYEIFSEHPNETRPEKAIENRLFGSPSSARVFVRRSQVAKFKPHAAEVFRLNREAVKYFEQYFDYKFPFPKYDLVLIPEFPFGGMEHAGATFLRESAIIFPQEPTKNDHISRALLMFHEASHQWFGDTVTMRWFDDLWLKEGFATFTAYKALEKIMPEMLAWKVFYERVKQAAYQTDSTKGTTPIYQEISNLSAAKSAYGAIVYNKAPAFLRQAEFYLGEDKFQTAVRAFLKKHEFGNAGWEDLVTEFEAAKGEDLKQWARSWVLQKGLLIYTVDVTVHNPSAITHTIASRSSAEPRSIWKQRVEVLQNDTPRGRNSIKLDLDHRFVGNPLKLSTSVSHGQITADLFFLNSKDYGYGIFLLDEKSREYVLKNIQNEKDPFLRAMMWGALWDSVREGELDPREFVELVVKVLGSSGVENHPVAAAATPLLRKEGSQEGEDESTTALLLNRVGTAMNYYMSVPPAVAGGLTRPSQNDGSKRQVQPPATAGGTDLRSRVEDLLIERMRNAPTLGQRITFYRAFLNIASSENARTVLKKMLTAETLRRGADTGGNLSGSEGVSSPPLKNTLPTGRVSASSANDATAGIPLKTKDRFDIVTRLLILGDPDAPKLLADLEKTETSDDAKRYAYAARAGIGTAENKAKYWNDFVNNKEISESWIEAAFGPWNSIRHSDVTLPYLERALRELPNHKRNRKIFFVNGWLGAFIGGQRSEEALAIVSKFLADNPALDRDLRLKILENADVIERAVKIRQKHDR